jgi:hypothetical protein
MLIAQPDPVFHMEPRKSWNRAFSSASMKEYEIIVAKRVRQLAGCLEDLIEYSDGNANGVVDMAVVEIFHVSSPCIGIDLVSTPCFHSTDFMGGMAFVSQSFL